MGANSAVVLALALLLALLPASTATAMATKPLTLRVELQQQLPLPEALQTPLALRLPAPPETLAEVTDLLRQHLLDRLHESTLSNAKPDNLELTAEVYDSKLDQFVPLESVTQLSRRARLSVTLANVDELFPAQSCLALPAKLFGLDGEQFQVDGKIVHVGEVGNSGKGTGLTTWDGSVVLAKYLEHSRRDDLSGSRIVELGAGTGLVGLSAALLGAREVILTDLDYVVDNLASNVALTLQHAKDAGQLVSCEVSTQVLDWFNPPRNLGDLDLVLASDVVWVEELIPPLVDTFDTLLRHSDMPTRVLMSYQKRSVSSDRLLFRELESHGLGKTRVPEANLHPEYTSDRIDVWEIARDESSGQ